MEEQRPNVGVRKLTPTYALNKDTWYDFLIHGIRETGARSMIDNQEAAA